MPNINLILQTNTELNCFPPDVPFHSQVHNLFYFYQITMHHNLNPFPNSAFIRQVTYPTPY